MALEKAQKTTEKRERVYRTKMEALEKQVMFDNNDCDDIFMTYELFEHFLATVFAKMFATFLMATVFLRGLGGGEGGWVCLALHLATCPSFKCTVRGALSLPSVLP